MPRRTGRRCRASVDKSRSPVEAILPPRSVHLNYRNHKSFVAARYNACNLIDTMHPLLMIARQTDYRRADGEAIARNLI
ncbi:hypothetical protein ACC699_38990, partial [Rhizobium ruizarguesonis]